MHRPRWRPVSVCLMVSAALGIGPEATKGQDMPDMSVEAIRAYADGAELYRVNDYSEAIPHFVRAHELDRSFFTPVFMHYVSAFNLGRVEAVDSLEAVLVQNRNRMSPYYQGMFDAVVLRRQQQYGASMATFHEVAERYPGTKAAYNYALYAWSETPREALRQLATLDPDREPIKGWINYWSARGSAQHTIGDLEGMLQSTREAQERHPDRLGPILWEVQALGALGRIDSLERVLARAEERSGWIPGLAYRDAGQELIAHGFADRGRGLLARAISWFDDEDTRTSVGATSQRAYTLYLLGRHSEARDAYRDVVERNPSPGNQVALATMSALAGDREVAEATLGQVHGGELGSNWRTRIEYELWISAALGDVANAKSAMARLGRRPLWVHRDPTLLDLLGEDPDFAEFLASGG